MNYKLLTILILLILNINIVIGVCTVNFDNNNPTVGQTIVAIMTCSEPQERSQSYTLTWRDQSNNIIQTDLGVTPATTNINFFESYTVSAGITSGNATLTGTNLEGSDSFIVIESNSTLIINNTKITDPLLVGKNIGINFDVYDSEGNEISGAKCYACQTLGNEVPLGACSEVKETVGGHGDTTAYISFNSFQENRQYLAIIHCNYDSIGDGLYDKNGVQSFQIQTDKWLEVNTVTDKDRYLGSQEIQICANVTNLIYDRRVNMNIYYQVRCSAEVDNNNDTDRNLIVSDNNKPDKRGISVNTTQNQCKKFILPEPTNLQGKSSSCYASTEVEVINEEGNTVVSYLTTSEMFNFTITDLNINADWQYINKKKIETKINLSDQSYNEYSGNSTGNLDIRLDRETESIRHEDQYLVDKIDIDKIKQGLTVASIEASYCNGSKINNFGLEYLNDGNMEIELRNVDLTPNGCYNVQVIFESEDNMLAITIFGIFIIILLIGIGIVGLWMDYKKDEK